MLLFFAIPVFWASFIYGVIHCLRNTRNRIQSKRPFVVFSMIWLLVTLQPVLFPFDPGFCGAWLTLQYAGQENVVKEGLSLMSDNLAYFEEEKSNDPMIEPMKQPKGDDIPRAIRRLNPMYVWVFEDEIALKKYGLGDFSGFVITKTPDTGRPNKLADHIYWVDP